MNSRNIFVVVSLLFSLGFTPEGSAQCVNSTSPTCGVYESCFSTRCSCSSSPFEYFKSYGKKYCEVFLDLPNLSSAGKAWRNATLRCLQEEIVPLLPKDGESDKCDCKDMQERAFDSHVACYTQATNSICALPASDWLAILNATDPIASLKDQKSRKQMLEVARICLPIAASAAKASIQSVIEKLEK